MLLPDPFTANPQAALEGVSNRAAESIAALPPIGRRQAETPSGRRAAVDLGLSGKSVLVTGGTGGIGQAVVRAFAAAGARVAIGYRTAEAVAEKLAAELAAHGRTAFPVRYALDEPDSPAQTVAAVEDRFGAVDVLVANAVRWGPRRPPEKRFDEVAGAEWEPVIAENLTPTIRTVQLVVPGMRTRGWGRIALISSHVALHGLRGQEFYGAAKAGLHGFARSVAWDVGRDDILVNVVCPGLTATERVLTGLPAPIQEQEIQRTPTGRLSRPEDVANVVLFLCSAANGNVTAEIVTVAGGR